MTQDEPVQIYELATRLAQESRTRRIIHIGDGPTDWLTRVVRNCEVLWIGAPELRQRITNKFPNAIFMDANLDEGLPKIPKDVFAGALVLCINVLDNLNDPSALTAELDKITKHLTSVPT